MQHPLSHAAVQWLRVTAALLASAAAIIAVPRKHDWIEGRGIRDGANRDYYNQPARLPWRNFLGDWHDAKNVPQGDAAYATVQIDDTDREHHVDWIVTDLVSLWLEEGNPNQGFFLRSVAGKGKIDFRSREHANRNTRPVLILKFAGREQVLPAEADTSLDQSTYQSQGGRESLRVARGAATALIRFRLPGKSAAASLESATLRLHTFAQYGAAQIGVFRCSQGHDAPETKAIPGIASRYPKDHGIENHPHVLFATGFESPRWEQEWTSLGNSVVDAIAVDPQRGFAPFHGKALRARIPQGEHTGLNAVYKFAVETGNEPEGIYLRYYLRLGDDWNQTIEGGKMPGISGAYGRSGWGGRRSNGATGWSARGLFRKTIPPGNPLSGTTPIGTYCYHADMPGRYGDNWIWNIGYRGYLENNRWYCIEQHLKLNTPAQKNGLLRAWIDGRPAFEKSDIRFRQHEGLKIEQIWMNVYHGGKRPSPRNQHLFIDNVVVATRYIGPLH